MKKIDLDYNIQKDLSGILSDGILDLPHLSEEAKISPITLNKILSGESLFEKEIYEKFYSFVYLKGLRLNKVKAEILKETTSKALFHGSKNGLEAITLNGSRKSCDFGYGFYLGETYEQALAFVYEKEGSSIYSFSYASDNLKIRRFQCDLEWMLAICYYRGWLTDYTSKPLIRKALKELEGIDFVIAPIANNRMFYIMRQFVDGDITVNAALHSLSASSLGLQYVFRSEKAIETLKPVEKYYISLPERKKQRELSEERTLEIDTKLHLAKREYRDGPYIEEILK